MNENLDLTKILDGCPKGIGFYSTVYGELRFVKIDDSRTTNPIVMEDDFNGRWIYFAKDGRSIYNCGECTLFPSKDQRDWSKFERFWDKQKSKELNKETYSAKETTTVEKAADAFSEMLVELWPDLLGFGGIAKKLENEFRKRLEE